MFEKILIANRGEIACRVIRTARRLGIHTVAVYSDADRDALHVSMADEAVHIGAAAPRESYLCGERIIAAARATGAQAIHPGYGFLSENAAFAQLCADNGLVFIGPPPEAIAAMGSKSAAKRIMEDAAVPLVPGYHGENQDDALLLAEAGLIGYPVLLKAAAGGGGKGMRRVDSAAEFPEALAAARRESDKAFGDSHMLVEKCLIRPRHVEIQVFCDNHGNGVYLFERDCSLQRRHQKVVEEAPAPGMTPAVRSAMGHAALRAAEAIGYRGAGTVEFLLSAGGEFYFMEMNTRLQVEHPVTEMITRQDLVEWQLRVAAGEPLPRRQEELAVHGHALEVRIYAEDPRNDFLPVTGRLAWLQPPQESEHVRVDTGVVQGDDVSIHYDPMIAKLVVWDETRPRALARLKRALVEYRIGGLTTNIAFLHTLVAHPAFAAEEVHTAFIEQHADAIFRDAGGSRARQLPLAALYLLLARERQVAERASRSADSFSPWHLGNAWRMGEPRIHRLGLLMNGSAQQVTLEEIGEGSARRYRMQHEGHGLMLAGRLEGNELVANVEAHIERVTVVPHDRLYTLFDACGATEFALVEPDLGEDVEHTGAQAFAAPMNGSVVTLLVDPGQRVAKGDALLIMEAMKMEHTIRAPAAGSVREFYFRPGDLVDGGAELLAFEARSD